MHMLNVTRSLALLLLESFPRGDPIDQFTPIMTDMRGAKSSNTTNLLVLDFNCGVGLTHESLSYQIYAVLNVWWRRHERQVLFLYLLSLHGCVMDYPVSLTNPILPPQSINRQFTCDA